MQVLMLNNGTWSEADDIDQAMVKACAENGGMVDAALTALGFEPWARIGADDFCPAPISLTVYFRSSKPPHFYIEVEGSHSAKGIELYAVRLPDVMDLLTRWTPMVQATSVTELIRLIRGGELEDEAKILLSDLIAERPARTS